MSQLAVALVRQDSERKWAGQGGAGRRPQSDWARAGLGGQGGWTREAPGLRAGFGAALFFHSLLGWAGLARAAGFRCRLCVCWEELSKVCGFR